MLLLQLLSCILNTHQRDTAAPKQGPAAACTFIHWVGTRVICRWSLKWPVGRQAAVAGRLRHDRPSPSAPQRMASGQQAPSQTGRTHMHLQWPPPARQPCCSVACTSKTPYHSIQGAVHCLGLELM